MEIQYQRHSRRKKKAVDFWLTVAKEYNDPLYPMTAEEIAKKHINPVTGRPYTRAHIYWILGKISKDI